MAGGGMDGWQRRRFLTALGAATPASWWLRCAPAGAATTALRVVTLGVEPFGYFDVAGHATGVYIELADSLSRESGIAFTNTVAPYPRAMAMMDSGEADLVFSIPNSALSRAALPVLSLFKGDVVVVGRPGVRYAGLADLHGKVVGQIRGAEYVDEFSADRAIIKHETINVEQTMRMLLEGRLDAAIGFRHAMYYALRTMKVPREKLGPALLLKQCEVWMFVSRSVHDPALIATLARAITTLRERGVIRDLLGRYFGGLPGQ